MSYLFIFGIFFVIIYYYHLNYTKLVDELREIRMKCFNNNNNSIGVNSRGVNNIGVNSIGVNSESNSKNSQYSSSLINNQFVGLISHVLDFLNNKIKSLE
jgi:hypothetical protein